jgi:hypothetical protein
MGQPALTVVMTVPDDRMEIGLFNIELRSLGGTQVRFRFGFRFSCPSFATRVIWTHGALDCAVLGPIESVVGSTRS